MSRTPLTGVGLVISSKALQRVTHGDSSDRVAIILFFFFVKDMRVSNLDVNPFVISYCYGFKIQFSVEIA